MLARTRPILLASLLAALLGCAPKNVTASSSVSPPVAAEPPPIDAGLAIDMEDPMSCFGCHPAVVAEWQQSMHSHAHHDADPLYAAMRTFRLAREGAGLSAKCASCHNPRAVENPDAPAGRAGVSCATCHNLAQVHAGRNGAAALERPGDGMLRGSHDLDGGLTPAHPTGPRLEALADGTTVCLACHAEERNKAGVPTCSTGMEHASVKDAASCTSCHMPEVAAPNGPQTTRTTHRSHIFAGPHRAWYQKDSALLESGVAVSGRFEKDRLLVSLKNQTSHAFPTGFPARMAVVVLRGLDRKGAEVWRNVTSQPMKEHPEAVLNMVYAGADGGTVLAPYGVRVARDTRLTPQETRELAVAVPKQVTQVEVSVKFWLIAPPAAAVLGVAELAEAKPVELQRVVVKR
jgi:hypothetical protein